jgi:hypothetical protein
MFDANKSLDENLEVFKTECEKIDAECAQILFDNFDILKRNGADRDARSRFNGQVKIALEALLDPVKPE